jgi:hypothetical protein
LTQQASFDRGSRGFHGWEFDQLKVKLTALVVTHVHIRNICVICVIAVDFERIGRLKALGGLR